MQAELDAMEKRAYELRDLALDHFKKDKTGSRKLIKACSSFLEDIRPIKQKLE